MAAPYDPRPTADRSPADVPLTLVGPGDLSELGHHLRTSVARAIDTETVYDPDGPDVGPGPLRVLSAATRSPDGEERAWVVDANAVDPAELAAAVDIQTNSVICDLPQACMGSFDSKIER